MKFPIKKMYNKYKKILGSLWTGYWEIKKSVGRTINTFGPNKNFHKFMRMLNHKFIK